ncbi:fibronectin type III domain-containing protein [Paenibacillus hodogayensis]|uniref:Fibronectin type III domain-containing protein n=1 Tax=Paenibacillus hodogayensis TaxID=279208 RepID=A0ABV5VXT6_9BACL
MQTLKRRLSTLAATVLAAALFVGQPPLLGPPTAYAAGTKIVLTPSMVTNESGNGDATLLVDEQAQAGTPKDGDAGNMTTAWQPGWGGGIYPASASIDLGRTYDLTEVLLFDSFDNGNVEISYGSPGSWSKLFDYTTNQYFKWYGHSVNVATRYVRVTMSSHQALIGEIVLYGTPSGGGGTDTVPPAAVTDLTYSNVTSSSVKLTWTAPGDDGNTGTASSYDIRYRASPITDEASWAAATRASGLPVPAVAGTSQSYTVTGLAANTTYYFALRTTDKASLVSGLSNVPRVTTAPAASTDTTPPAAIMNLTASSPTATTAVLSWTAPGDDGNAGRASSYEVRYAKSTITGFPDTWSGATVFPQTITPQNAGSREALTVSGLVPGQRYSFNVRAKDEAGNVAGLSNSIGVMTKWDYSYANAGMIVDMFNDPTFGTLRVRKLLDRFELYGWDNPAEWTPAFTVRAEGQLTPAYSETYTFYAKTTAKDRIRLWVNRQLLIDTWDSPTDAEKTAAIALSANQSAEIRAEYKAEDKSGNVKVSWSSPSQPKEVLRAPRLQALPDRIAPGAIGGLAATAAGSTAVKLAFKAPGDDDLVLPGRSGAWGAAAEYEVRYAATPITAGNWEQAIKADIYAIPHSPGDDDAVTVSGLRPGTTYHFAARVKDEAGNAGPVSASVSATTTGTADMTAPSAPAGLSATGSDKLSVQLAWTAPGNDGNTGTAAAYDLRYGTSPISAANWNSAERAFGMPSPAIAGTQQTMTMKGLRPGTTYYFSLKATDEVGNVSPIAFATATTAAAPGGYVLSGASTLDLYASSNEAGSLYYVVYNAAQGSPTAAAIKAAAQGAVGGSVAARGVIPVAAADAGKLLKATSGALADNRTYYTYWVGEGQTTGFGPVYGSTDKLEVRHKVVSFNSPVANAGNLNYLAYQPEETYRSPNGKYPLLLFLHGQEEDGSDIEKVKKHGPPKLIAAGKEMPFIVISPQLPWRNPVLRWYTPGLIDSIVNDAMKRYPIDPQRIYVTGLSVGGGGALYYANEHPEKVAAVLPVAPQMKWFEDETGNTYLFNPLNAFRMNNIPLWMFANRTDEMIQRRRIEWLLDFMANSPVPPNPSPLLTIYQQDGHGGWTETYDNPDVYTWLLNQSK